MSTPVYHLSLGILQQLCDWALALPSMVYTQQSSTSFKHLTFYQSFAQNTSMVLYLREKVVVLNNGLSLTSTSTTSSLAHSTLYPLPQPSHCSSHEWMLAIRLSLSASSVWNPLCLDVLTSSRFLLKYHLIREVLTSHSHEHSISAHCLILLHGTWCSL